MESYQNKYNFQVIFYDQFGTRFLAHIFHKEFYLMGAN